MFEKNLKNNTNKKILNLVQDFFIVFNYFTKSTMFLNTSGYAIARLDKAFLSIFTFFTLRRWINFE